MKHRSVKKRLVALATTVMTLVMCMAGTMSASAANISVFGGSFDFTKYLVMNENANVPNATFEFTIEAGEAVNADGTNPAIYAGDDSHVTGAPTISNNATFTPDDDTYDSAVSNDSVTLEPDEKYAKKTVTVNFSHVSFSAPGIYRYIITETQPTQDGVAIDGSYTRTLDVFVEYENETTSGQLKISKYALQDGTSANPQTSKSQGFTNTYTTYDLTLEKQVTGNQGDRDKYFAFSITIGNIESSGTKFTVSTSNNRDNPTELVASSEVGDTGTYSATGTVYLKDNETITIYGLTEEMTYTIEETDYTTTDGYTTTNTDNTGVGADGKSTGVQTMGANDKTVTFINEKKGIIPTGILLETAPYIILAVVVIAGFVVLCATRRRRSR